MTAAVGEWLKPLCTSGQWRLLVGRSDVSSDALYSFAAAEFVDSGAAFYRVTCSGETVFQSGLRPDLLRWLLVISVGVPDALVAAARGLPLEPSDLAANVASGLTYLPIAPSVTVAPELVRPDGSAWSVDDVDAVLGGASVSQSIHSDAYQGVVCYIKPRSRLVVNGSLRSYVVQTRFLVDGLPHWRSAKGGRSFTRSRLLETCGVKGVKKALKGLPENPADALPKFTLLRSAQTAAFAFTDWRRDDYQRVLAQSADVRLIVMPTADKYQVQRVEAGCWNGVHGSNAWMLVAGFQSAFRLGQWLQTQTLFAGWETLTEAMTDLPNDPSDGVWPDLPIRPETA